MKNYVSSGDILTMTAPEGGVKSGKFIAIGALCGYPQTDAAGGEKFALKTLGVYVETVAADAPITAGTPIFWDGAQLTTAGDDLVDPVGDALYDTVPSAGYAEVHLRLRG